MISLIERSNRALVDAVSGVFDSLVDVLPEALLAIVTVIVGWVFASIVYALCLKFMRFFAVDKLLAKTPMDRMLKGVGIRKSSAEVLALLFFWLTILITLFFASEILELNQVSLALAVITAYIPQVIAAFLILVFGMLLARFLQTIVSESLARLEIGYERTIGKVVQVVILVVVLLAAIEQLGFDLSFVTSNVLIVVAAFLLVGGLSIVIGARAVLENVLACQQLKRLIAEGDTVQIGEISGKITGFSVAGVMIASPEGEAVVPAKMFFTHTYIILQRHGG